VRARRSAARRFAAARRGEFEERSRKGRRRGTDRSEPKARSGRQFDASSAVFAIASPLCRSVEPF